MQCPGTLEFLMICLLKDFISVVCFFFPRSTIVNLQNIPNKNVNQEKPINFLFQVASHVTFLTSINSSSAPLNRNITGRRGTQAESTHSRASSSIEAV